MLQFVATQRQKNNIFMTVLGFGIIDYDDSIMRVIADNGDGNYYYVDTERKHTGCCPETSVNSLYHCKGSPRYRLSSTPKL